MYTRFLNCIGVRRLLTRKIYARWVRHKRTVWCILFAVQWLTKRYYSSSNILHVHRHILLSEFKLYFLRFWLGLPNLWVSCFVVFESHLNKIPSMMSTHSRLCVASSQCGPSPIVGVAHSTTVSMDILALSVDVFKKTITSFFPKLVGVRH